ncbi:hypothetical protein H5T88_03600 [bacterium]|nr:hypothetical protein [bacterium]
MPSFIPGEGGFKPTIPPGVPYGAQLLTLGENRFLLLADIVSGKSASVSNYSYPVCERKVWFVSKEGEKELPIGPIGYSLHQPFEIRYSPPYLSYVVRKGHKNSQKVLTSQFFLYDLSTDKEKYLGEFKGTYSARILPYHVAFPSLPQSYIIEHLISLASSDSSRIKHRLNFYIGVEEKGKGILFRKFDSMEGKRGEVLERPCVWETRVGVFLSVLLVRPTDEPLFLYKKEGEKVWHSISLGEIGFFDYKISPEGQYVAFLLEEDNARVLKLFSLATQANVFITTVEGEKIRNMFIGFPEGERQFLLPSSIRWDEEEKHIIAFARETILEGKPQILWFFNIDKGGTKKIELPFQRIWDVLIRGENQLILVAGNPLKDTPDWGIYEFYMGKKGEGIAKPIKVFKVKETR